MIHCLQSILSIAQDAGFETSWDGDNLVLFEQRRIIDWEDGRWTIYGVTSDEIDTLFLRDKWGIWLMLGGPPIWQTRCENAVIEAQDKFCIPVVKRIEK